jgi:glycosyltransferase involved in cell wall biosynthesis
LGECLPNRDPSVLILNWRDTGHPDGGGSEVYVEMLADGLAARGYRVTLMAARYDGSAAEETRPNGVRIFRRGGRFGVYPRAALAYLRRDCERPDVIIEVQNGVPFLSRLWARKVNGIVLVHHVHREQWRVVLGPVLARLGWWMESRLAPRVNRGSQYVAVSQRTREELSHLGVRRSDIQVIHNGAIPPPQVSVERASTPTLLVLGRLVPHKRIEIAIDTTAELCAEFPDLQLVVGGKGWWEAELRRYAQDLGMGDRVRFAGYAEPGEKHALYARAWVFLVPSVKEGWGQVVIEAATHATPTVAFRYAGGIAESVIDGETGLLADSTEDFADSVRRLLRDRALRERLGQDAAQYGKRFTWDQAVADFDALIRKLV